MAPVGSGRFVAETFGAGRKHHAKNASQACDLAVWMGVPTARLPDVEPETRFSALRKRVFDANWPEPLQRRSNVGSSRVDLQACKLEYSIVSPK